MSRLKADPDRGLYAPTDEVLQRMRAGEQFLFATGSTSDLAAHLGHALNRPVVDEVRIEGYYHFCFPFDQQNDPPQKAIKQVEEKYGLCLKPDERIVKIYVVEDADAHAEKKAATTSDE